MFQRSMLVFNIQHSRSRSTSIVYHGHYRSFPVSTYSKQVPELVPGSYQSCIESVNADIDPTLGGLPSYIHFNHMKITQS